SRSGGGGRRGSPASSCSLSSFLRSCVPPVAADPVKTLGEIAARTIGNGNEVTEFRRARSHSDSPSPVCANQRDFVFGPRRLRHTRNATTATAPPTSAPTTRNREPKDAPDAERTWTDNVPIVDCPAPSKALT